MAMREKLDKLLSRWLGHLSLAATDDLIANGVTIQRWIPVTDRLPENYQKVLCIMQYDGEFRVLRWNYIDYMWNTGIEWFKEKDVTHWMPLPEAPKAEMEKADLPNISKDTMNALNRMGANAHREENP